MQAGHRGTGTEHAEALEQRAGESSPMGMRRSHEALLGLALALCAGFGSVTEAPAREAAVPPMELADAPASSTAVPLMEFATAPAASTAVLSVDAEAALATAQYLLEQAGLRWEDSPTTVMVEAMSNEQANARVGRYIEYPDQETRLMTVWLAALSGRYMIVPQLPEYDVVGPFEQCVNVIFDTAGGLIDIGSGCPKPLPTPTAAEILTPTSTDTPLPTAAETIPPTFTASPIPTATIEPAPTPAPWAVQSPDFGFRFENLSCYNDVLDTFEGTFTTDVGSAEPTPVTVPMHLTDEQMTAVYEKMVEIGFWDYPANFAVPLDPSGGAVYVEPQSHFRIVVRNAGVEQGVDWLIQYVQPTNEDAEQLLTLINMITEMITSSPDYQLVPDRGYACL